MPRFAVLRHDWPHPHLDLFVEGEGVLKAWRLPVTFDPTVPCPAEACGDHRRLYLDYEGPVSGGRGTVSDWDRGAVTWEHCEPDRLRLRFDGRRVRGRYELVCRREPEWELVPLAPDSLGVGLAAGA